MTYLQKIIKKLPNNYRQLVVLTTSGHYISTKALRIVIIFIILRDRPTTETDITEMGHQC